MTLHISYFLTSIFGYVIPFAIKPVWIAIGGWILVLGVIGFFMMGIDKGRAEGGYWRLSEMSLLTIAYLGGFWGILLGSKAFHHKTRKVIFMGLAYGATGLWIWILWQAIGVYGNPLTG